MKKTYKYIFASAVLSATLLLGACNGKKSDSADASGRPSPMKEAHEKYIKNLTSSDTTEVIRLCSDFLTSLQEQRFDDAVANIYKLDSLGTPQHLSEQEITSLRRRTQLFPVISYKCEEMTFFMPTENKITYSVAFNNDTPPATMGWGFCPVFIDNKWFLTFL